MEMDPRHNKPGSDNADDSQAMKDKEFFGFEVKPEDDKEDNSGIKSFIAPESENEAATTVYNSAGGFFGQSLDTRGDNYANERQLIGKYRNAAMQPEVDAAIQDIVNEAIVHNDELLPVSLNLDLTDLDDDVKEKFNKEFYNIVEKLDFRKYGSDAFRRWYIDGKLIYHIVIDMNNPGRGIQDLRAINPSQIQKVRDVKKEQDRRTGMEFVKSVEEYYIYTDEGFQTGNSMQQAGASGNQASGLKLAKDSVCYVSSGLTDASKSISLSYLHKSLRCINQLRMMEDSLIIYRLARAPERRIFSIDVGDMPKKQAEEYIHNLMSKYKNKITYDAESGEINSNRHHQHMLEDFWLPKTADGKGTSVETLPGGQNLDAIADIEYFQKKLFQSMNVPVSRLNPGDTPYTLGKTNEIDREELRFQKFIDKLRVRFAELFKQLLRTQLILKGLLKEAEWESIREDIIIDYNRDNYFAELKEAELMKERIETLTALGFSPNEFFSREYIRKNILKQTDEEIEEIKAQMRQEHLNNDELFRKLEGGAGADDFTNDDFGGGGTGALGDMDFGGDDLGGDEGEIELGEPAGAATDIGDELDTDTPEIDLDDL